MKISALELGIYEKAMPAELSWPERLAMAGRAGFNSVELSIDESNWRLERLDWNVEKRAELRRDVDASGIEINSICLSGHRRFPLGSGDPKIRQASRDILYKTIGLARDINAGLILVPGYDVFYEKGNEDTRQRFWEGMQQAVVWAGEAGVMLAMENTDTYITSISQAKQFIEQLGSNWLRIYGDIGNLVALGYNVSAELQAGRDLLAAIHVKDARPGIMRDVPFGEGVVPFKEAFRKLQEINYTGPVTLEVNEDSQCDPEKRLHEMRTWIQRQMDIDG